LLENELDEDYLKVNSFTEVVDLEDLRSLRVFAVCIHMLYWEDDEWDDDNPPNILTAFPWLFRFLKTLPISNSLEELDIQLVYIDSYDYESVPTGFCGHFPWEKFESLFTEQFPHLRKLKLLLQTHQIPVLREIVDLGHAFAVGLLQRGILEIKELDPYGEYRFCAALIVKSQLTCRFSQTILGILGHQVLWTFKILSDL